MKERVAVFDRIKPEANITGRTGSCANYGARFGIRFALREQSPMTGLTHLADKRGESVVQLAQCLTRKAI